MHRPAGHTSRNIHRALLLGFILGALVLGIRNTTPTAEACAFDPLRPTAYEADALRNRYLLMIDAASQNRLFPSDSFFRLPAVEVGTRTNRADGIAAIPVEVLRAIGWVESSLTMASKSTRFESIGPALVSFDCGHGIMQVTSGMTVPLGTAGHPSDNQIAVATSDAHNIARGARILAAKWNDAPSSRPIVGTDTAGDPTLLENWYYAIWSYNGFTSLGSKKSNHPLDPNLSWPRAKYLCDGTQSRSRYPYQELVIGCMANPAERGGSDLWVPVPVTLPDFTQPQFFNAIGLANFTSPYQAMDIPTPQPAHRTQIPLTSNAQAAQLIGEPRLRVNDGSVTIHVNGTPAQKSATIRVANPGTRILSWSAIPSDSFLVVDPPAGSAVGNGTPCSAAGCPDGEFTITINPTLLSATNASGTVVIASPNASGSTEIKVHVFAEFEVAAPGTSRSP